MKHYLIQTNCNGVQEFTSFWADDEEHALEQLDDESAEYNARQFVTHMFVSKSHIDNVENVLENPYQG